MSILSIVKIVFAIATIAIGLLAFVRPASVTRLTGLVMPGPRAVSEVRASLGGLFIGLGVAPLIYPIPAAYHVLGLGYAAAGAARLFSIIVDKSTERTNLIFLASEIVFAVVLLL